MNKTDFTSENAAYQVKRGIASYVKGKDLGDEHVGRGLYRELWRDSTWDYICKVTHLPDETVWIEFIRVETADPTTQSPAGSTTVVESRVSQAVHKTDFADDEWDLVITNAPVEKPQGRRITTVRTTTTIEQTLPDIEIGTSVSAQTTTSTTVR
jgi:hypothetical protein